MTERSEGKAILLTGGTGYVGGRLLKELEADGRPLRAIARRPGYLRDRAAESTQVVQADALDRDSLDRALQGVGTVYYLIHSMGARGSFVEQDRLAARNFAEAAARAGVERIIYLGGLGAEREELSPHLRSRQEVGDILRQSGCAVLEFRASIVIGSGSLSFEMIRALVERLPIMITPRWVSVLAQPIAVEDLIRYLIAARDLPVGQDAIFEIGGADKVSYAGIMKAYARVRGLTIRMIPVPFLTPYLSSLWLGLVTPVYARIGRKLIESIVHATVVTDMSARQAFDIEPIGIEQAVRQALLHEDRKFAATRWSDAVSSAGDPAQWAESQFATRMVDFRKIETDLPPEAAFQPIQRIGGKTGWYAVNYLWGLRGFLDLLVGGAGHRRGRSHPTELRVGDTVDFWRVAAFEPGRRLRLQAEMKLPGRAWLEYEVEPSDGGSTLYQTAIFDPLGLWGRLYWYVLYPVHRIVFQRMLAGIVKAARQRYAQERST